jgi:hypothetical protein
VPLGLDLATEWRSRRWRKLLNIIDGLPRTSAFVNAMANDDEIADVLLEAAERQSSRPTLEEYTPEREALDAVRDLLGQVVAGLLVLNRQKPPRLKLVPRPETAIDRARRRQQLRRHESLVARLLPNNAT